VWFQKISIPHHRGLLESPRGRGILRAKSFESVYEPKMEFPEGRGEYIVYMDIFWNNTL